MARKYLTKQKINDLARARYLLDHIELGVRLTDKEAIEYVRLCETEIQKQAKESSK